MGVVVFILVCYGASNIMVYSSIFEKWRKFFDKISPKFFGELFDCMICLPFWWGVIVSIFAFSPTMVSFNINNVAMGAFLDGCLASGSVWLLHTLQENLEQK